MSTGRILEENDLLTFVETLSSRSLTIGLGLYAYTNTLPTICTGEPSSHKTVMQNTKRKTRRMRKKGLQACAAPSGIQNSSRSHVPAYPALHLYSLVFSCRVPEQSRFLSARTHPISCFFGQRSVLMGKQNFVADAWGPMPIQPNRAGVCQNGANEGPLWGALHLASSKG
jgi:hypothetical protein